MKKIKFEKLRAKEKPGLPCGRPRKACKYKIKNEEWETPEYEIIVTSKGEWFFGIDYSGWKSARL